MNIRILAEARAEMLEAHSYLGNETLSLGERFLKDLSNQLLAISKNPFRFSKLETLADDQPYRRALLKKFRYIIVFEIVNNEIVVIAFSHSSREPNYWLK